MDHPDFERRLFASKLKRKPCNFSQDVPPNGSLGAKRAKIAHSDVSASEGEKSTARTGSHKKIVFTDNTEREPVARWGVHCFLLIQSQLLTVTSYSDACVHCLVSIVSRYEKHESYTGYIWNFA
jgi:hypothetical protein